MNIYSYVYAYRGDPAFNVSLCVPRTDPGDNIWVKPLIVFYPEVKRSPTWMTAWSELWGGLLWRLHRRWEGYCTHIWGPNLSLQDNADQLYNLWCQVRWGHHKSEDVPQHHGQVSGDRTWCTAILVCTHDRDIPCIHLVNPSGCGGGGEAVPDGVLVGTLVWEGAWPILPWVLTCTPAKNWMGWIIG